MENKKEEKIKFKIPVEDLIPSFKEHLSLRNNSRIFFSGKFGIGKTYFLRKFFNEKKNDYNVFHLFPINYQISSNNDIIDFIKYDILVELVKNNPRSFQDNDFSSFSDLKRLFFVWSKNNLSEIFKTGLDYIPKLGRPLKDIVILLENFLEFKKKIESRDKSFVDDFLREIKKKNISETDYLSELIRQKIKKDKVVDLKIREGNNISEKENVKESVLVLDDLDRIDPEHIFRILNVFSAHFNKENEELPNKFGFDRIIFVGHYNNIKSIFHHKYGEGTDFRAYFNKFFKFKVYEFNNEKIVEKYIFNVIKDFDGVEKNIELALKDSSGFIKLLLEDILKRALSLKTKEQLDLRQLLRATEISFPIFKNKNCNIDRVLGRHQKLIQWVDISIRILISIFDGVKNNLRDTLIKIKEEINNYKGEKLSDYIYDDYSKYITGELIEKFFDEENEEWRNESQKVLGGYVYKNSTELFYNLLIKYLESDKYKKSVYDYDK